MATVSFSKSFQISKQETIDKLEHDYSIDYHWNFDYTICTEEDIQAIEHYILEIEIKLYNALDGGDSNK